MKAAELRQKSQQELQTELQNLLKEQFNIQMQKGNNQNIKPHLYKQVRRNIARVKTILHEKNSQSAKRKQS